jgi:cytochrome c oxidase assembly factor CtaG
VALAARRVNPWLAVTVFNLVLMVWHWPSLYEATLQNEMIHVVEHLMFIATAFVFWWPIVGPGSRGARRMSPLMKVGYLAFAGVPPTVVGITMAFLPTLLYPFYTTAPRLLDWLAPQLDQELAGILMFGIGNLIYFVPITRNFFRIADETGALPA